jgi:hypothetical protein
MITRLRRFLWKNVKQFLEMVFTVNDSGDACQSFLGVFRDLRPSGCWIGANGQGAPLPPTKADEGGTFRPGPLNIPFNRQAFGTPEQATEHPGSQGKSPKIIAMQVSQGRWE